MRVDVIGGQTVQLLGTQLHRADVVADHPREVLRDLDEPCRDLAQPRAHRVVLIDTAAAEVAQDVLAHPVGLFVADRCAGGDDLEQTAVELAIGFDRAHLLAELLGRRPDGCVRMDLGDHCRDRARVAEFEIGVVPQLEHLEACFGTSPSLSAAPSSPARSTARLHSIGQPSGPVVGRQVQRRDHEADSTGRDLKTVFDISNYEGLVSQYAFHIIAT